MTLTTTTDTGIGINVPAQTLHYTPGAEPTQFVVDVVNQSDRFATMHLDIFAPGNEEGSTAWYDLTPEISTRKPPGDRTSFHISILGSPIPGFAGLVNLIIRVTSLELGEERRIIRVYVDPGGELPIGIKMPVRHFQASPLDQIQIPVFLENPSHEKSRTSLWIEGIPPDWVIGGLEHTFDIPADSTIETTLMLRLPNHVKAIHGAYPFTLRAVQPGGTTSEAEGCLEVLAQGHVTFSCTPEDHVFPVRDRHYQWGRHGVYWDASFENKSNIPLKASLSIEGDDRAHLPLQVVPDQTVLEPGKHQEIQLGALISRHWVGFEKRMRFVVHGTVSDKHVDVQHDTHLVKLRIPPRIPLWLQGLGSFIILYFIWWFSWLNPGNPYFGHRAAVNSVELSGTTDEVISGSNDQTSIKWRVKGFFNPIINQQLGRSPDAGKAIRVVRYRPVNNDWLAAGLENGEIQLSSLTGQGHTTTFSLSRDDRVMDLEFTYDSRHLLSGHGSGAVLQWAVDYPQGDRNDIVRLPVRLRQFDFAVYGIAIVGENRSTLAVGGRYNRLSIWDWQRDTVLDIDYPHPGSQNQYITSVDAVFFNPYLMATADNQGYITLWDLKPCLISSRPCNVLDEWENGHGGEPVRDVALSPYGCYLTSAGADGRVMLWPLSSAGTRSVQYREGIQIERSRTPFTSTDIKIWDDDILIASGNENTQVSVHRRDRIYDSLCDLPPSSP
ncbi:MAG: WD40 repeat domain-containing protein [Leptolyngbyaceae bacterium]|nr:WD40 repeat domain-containing protein [Leptolyngbyaceae bacterium]